MEKIDEVQGNKFVETLLEGIFPIYGVQNGRNAIYAYLDNLISMPPDNKLSLAVFHELGHALNHNVSKIGKTLQKMKMPGMTIASSLAMFAFCSKESKAEDGKELTKAQKAKNLVRKNVGPLAFLSLTPMLIEEAMASVKGCKWANKNMAQDLAKKVTKTNAIAYCSYLIGAVGLALGAHVALRVKDALVAKKEAKLEAKQADKFSA